MKNQSKVVFFIGLIVVITIAIQFYWNYIQYKNNKQQVVNDVQFVLDNTVESYYTDLSKESVIYVFQQDTLNTITPNSSLSNFNEIIEFPDSLGKPSNMKENMEEVTEILRKETHKFVDSALQVKNFTAFQDQEVTDNFLNDQGLLGHLAKVLLSVQNDSIHFEDFKLILNKELQRKNIISLDYILVHTNQSKDILGSTGEPDNEKYPLVSVSQSVLLPDQSRLEMYHSNIFWITLKKGTTGILLSLILSSTVIFCLFYLLHIIKKQKQLSEIKNDFISNITHELKTPLATVTSAIEGIQAFNEDNDQEKTQKYLEVSVGQLEKLRLLVDKIMETSILESADLILEKKPVNLVPLLKSCIERYRPNTNKTIVFENLIQEFVFDADELHLENAISNLIENAIKYGGNELIIRFVTVKEKAIIEIFDNGEGIPKEHQKMIFDKFYRIPNKNKHDVKGFGIGLYYTKNIIEKHDGTIELESKQNYTIFRILL